MGSWFCPLLLFSSVLLSANMSSPFSVVSFPDQAQFSCFISVLYFDVLCLALYIGQKILEKKSVDIWSIKPELKLSCCFC